MGGTVTAQDARQGSQSGNAAPFRGFRTISLYGLGQWSASMPFWGDCGDCGDCGGSLGAGRPPGLSERQCGPFPGFQDNIYGLGQWSASMPFWGDCGDCGGESRRRTPARALRAAMWPLSGVSGQSSTVWGNGALLCPSGAIVGIAWGAAAAAALRRAAGWSRRESFRSCGGGSAWRSRRPWGGLEVALEAGTAGTAGTARRSLRGLGTRFPPGPRSLFPPA